MRLQPHFLYILDIGNAPDGTLLIKFGVASLVRRDAPGYHRDYDFYLQFDTPLEEPRTYASVIGVIGYENRTEALEKLTAIQNKFTNAREEFGENFQSDWYKETRQMTTIFKDVRDGLPYIIEACNLGGGGAFR